LRVGREPRGVGHHRRQPGDHGRLHHSRLWQVGASVADADQRL